MDAMTCVLREDSFQNLRRNITSSHRQHDGALKGDRSSVPGKQKGISCSYYFLGERERVIHIT